MMQRVIKLRVDEVNDFVTAACKCDFDIDVSYNHYTIDAKSIVGVLGLDFRNALTVTCHGYNREFESYLNRFAMVC